MIRDLHFKNNNLKRHTSKSVAYFPPGLRALRPGVLRIPLQHFLIRMADPILQLICRYTSAQMQRCPSSPEFMKCPFIADRIRGAKLPFLRYALPTVHTSSQRDRLKLREKMSLRFCLSGREYQPAAGMNCPMDLERRYQFVVDGNVASF
jgi:hypothetical protein